MGEAVNSFFSLPDEICVCILDFLDGRTLVAVQQTCQRFRRIVEGDYLYRLSKPLIDRLPYQKKLEAYEELLKKVSKREKAWVAEELQWLENLEFICWEKLYKLKGLRDRRKNSMKALLKEGKLETGNGNLFYSEADVVIAHMCSFIRDLVFARIGIAEREKVLLRELVLRCARLEEEGNFNRSINILVLSVSYEFTLPELRMFVRSLLIEVAAMSPRSRKKAIDRITGHLTWSGIQDEEEMKEILRAVLAEIEGSE